MDFKSIDQVEALTFQEYRLLMKAQALKQIDRERDLYLLAWNINQVKATKGKGKSIRPVFKNFKDFFDYDKLQDRVLNRTQSTEDKYKNYKAYIKRKEGIDGNRGI